MYRILGVAIVAASFIRCGSAVRMDDIPPMEASFTTMGTMIPAPGRPTTCPEWFFEHWTASVSRDGVADIEVSDGQRVVWNKRRQLTAKQHQKIASFVARHLAPSPEVIGQFATDSDFGVVQAGGQRLEANGALEVEAEFRRFYRLINFLERELDIPNPYCR